MANQINTRILLKYDSYSNWMTNKPVLLAGEIAIATITSGDTQKVNSVAIPQCLIKVGNGTSTYDQLPFTSALAADVYTWAKRSENDFVNGFLAMAMSDGTTMQSKLDAVFATDAELTTAIGNLRSEVAGNLATELAKYYTKAEIDALIADYYNKSEVDGLFTTEIARADATAKELADAALVDAKEYTDEEINKIVTGSGYATTKYVDDAVADHKDAVDDQIDEVVAKFADYSTTTEMNAQIDADVLVETNRATAAEEALGVRIDNLTTKHNNHETTVNAELADRYTKAEADAAFMNQDEVDARVNKVISDAVEGDALTSLTELVQYINTHGGEAAEMATAIENIEKQLNGIDPGTGTVKKYIDDAITALKIGDYAKAADLADLAARVKAIEDAPYATTGNVATAKQEAINAAAGDATTKANKALDDAKADAAAKYEEIGVAQVLVDGLGIADYLKKADAEVTYEKIGVAQTLIDNINYNSDDDSDVGDSNVNELVYKVTQEKGKVVAHKVNISDVKTALNLAEIATTGSIYDVVEGTETDKNGKEYLVFYCGTSTDLV